MKQVSEKMAGVVSLFSPLIRSMVKVSRIGEEQGGKKSEKK